MKLLFIGPYRDGSGWSKSALDMIKAINSTDIDIVARPVKYNNYLEVLEPEIQKCEDKDSKNCDAVFYYVPPDHIVYSSSFAKNICWLLCETNSIKKSTWVARLNCMDEVWVPSHFIKEVAINSGVNVPVKVVHLPTNTDKFCKRQGLNEQIVKQKNGDFLFYSILDFNRRKHLAAIIKAFHLEFHINEPVNLALKISKNQVMREAYKTNVLDFCENIKEGLKKRRCKKEILLSESYLTDKEICDIHNSCDVFISTSYGEGWCIPAFDAMGFGKTPIVTNWSSYTEYITDKEGWLVDYDLEPVFGMQEHPSSLYFGDELWANVSVPHLRKSMRLAYENQALRQTKAEAGIEKVFDFSYERIGESIKKVLLNDNQQHPIVQTTKRD